jgi:hypothetical protein
MRNLALVLIVAGILTVYQVTSIGSGQQTTQAIGREHTLTTAQATYDSALDTAVARVMANYSTCIAAQSGPSPTPCPAITTAVVAQPAIPGATVAIEGDSVTTAAAGTAYASANVEQVTQERRIALDISINGAGATVFAPHRVVLRVWNGQSGIQNQLLSDEPIGSTIDPTPAPDDNGGCNGASTGCDPNASTSPDPTVVQALIACNPGVGSGTCPGSGNWNVSTYASSTWGNSQLKQTP